jgi:hypothetical protein
MFYPEHLLQCYLPCIFIQVYSFTIISFRSLCPAESLVLLPKFVYAYYPRYEAPRRSRYRCVEDKGGAFLPKTGERWAVSGEHLHAVTDLWDKSLFLFLAVYRSVAEMYVQPKRVSCYIFFFIYVCSFLPFPNYCHRFVLLAVSVPRVCVDVPTLTLQPIATVFWWYVFLIMQPFMFLNFLITQATATRSRVSIMQMSPDGVSRTSYGNTVMTGIPYR